MGNLNWDLAHKHLLNVIREYQESGSITAADKAFALDVVLKPLARRYERGERTRKLFDDMLLCE